MAGKRPGKREKLTPRQQAFVRAYLKHGVGKKAAIEAGYSPLSAEQTSSELLKDPKVSEALGQRAESIAEKAGIEAVDILRELKRLAMVDLGQAYLPNGKLKPIHDIPEDTRRAMAGLETEEVFGDEVDDEGNVRRAHQGDVRKVKFYDKTKALDLLGKHFKLFTDVVEHRHSLKDLVEESMDEEGDE